MSAALTGFLLALVVVLAALFVRERRSRRTQRGEYIGRLWFLRAQVREKDDEIADLNARLLAMTLHGADDNLASDADHIPLPAFFTRRTPPA